MDVFPHQLPVFEELLRTARAFFAPHWRQLPVAPRFSRLIIGESGSGKSFLASAVAKEMEVPIWNLTATNWLPIGVSERGARQSWADLAAFVAEHDRGVIVIDEVDKLGKNSSPWMTCVRLEIFSLIDGEVPINLRARSDLDNWDEESEYADVASIQRKLAECFLVLAAGAFQMLWEDARRPVIGFGDEQQNVPPSSLRELSQILPTELTNRFAPPPLIIPPMLRSDYEALLSVTVANLDLSTREIVLAIGARTLDAAIQDRLGCRWIQQVMLHTATRLSLDDQSNLKEENNPDRGDRRFHEPSI